VAIAADRAPPPPRTARAAQRLELSARGVAHRLAEPFVISRRSVGTARSVEVTVTLGAVRGYGAAVPTLRYGESVESALAFLAAAAERLGVDPFAFEALEARLADLSGERAARAALDGALHDLCGKLVGLPAWRLLGNPRTGPPSSFTISLADPDTMARRAETISAFHRLKLKLAGDGSDLERVQAVRRATSLRLSVDANEAWSLAQALDLLPRLAELGVELVEQPLRAGDPEGARLKRASPVPIVVDEDLRTLADVAACAERAHGVNVKLAKAGGIREAIRIVHAARALGLRVMVGCMTESGLAVAAACCVAPLADWVDLDGNLLLARDPWRGVELVDGVQVPSSAPGLGVTRRPLAAAEARLRHGVGRLRRKLRSGRPPGPSARTVA
jgi:L-alanine-DL-glutamate epimerase-like enolase superfamily enzyme